MPNPRKSSARKRSTSASNRAKPAEKKIDKHFESMSLSSPAQPAPEKPFETWLRVKYGEPLYEQLKKHRMQQREEREKRMANAPPVEIQSSESESEEEEEEPEKEQAEEVKLWHCEVCIIGKHWTEGCPYLKHIPNPTEVTLGPCYTIKCICHGERAASRHPDPQDKSWIGRAVGCKPRCTCHEVGDNLLKYCPDPFCTSAAKKKKTRRA